MDIYGSILRFDPYIRKLNGFNPMSSEPLDAFAPAVSRPSAGWFAACRTVLMRFLEVSAVWEERRESRRRLAEMDDHLLRDIGISRADAFAESEKPFWRA